MPKGDKERGAPERKKSKELGPSETKESAVKLLSYITQSLSRLQSETGYAHSSQRLLECVRTLEKLSEPTVDAIRRTLFEHDVPSGVIARLSRDSGQTLELRGEELKAIVVDTCTRTLQRGLEFKNDGQKFLGSIISSMRSIETDHVRGLRALEERLRTRGASESEIGCVYLAYACIRNYIPSTAGQRSEDIAFGKIVRMVEAQTHLDPQEGEEGFFSKLLRCVTVYADISEEVLKQSGRTDTELQKKAARSLAEFLQRPEFQTVRWRKEDSAPEPFIVLQTELREKPDANPWLTSSLKDTPFDERKFWTLISPDVPRGLLAEAIVGLNGYQLGLLAERAERLARSIGEKDTVPRNKVQDYAELLSDLQKLSPSHYVGLQEIPSPAGRLAHIVRLSPWRDRHEIVKGGDLHPMAALLRIVNPQKIVRNQELWQQFNHLFSAIEVPRGKNNGAEGNRKAIRQIAAIAASIRDVLAERDPFLDVPLIASSGSQSLRTMLVEFARKRFDKEIIAIGPYAHIEESTGPFRELYTPIDLMEYTNERLEAMKRNFDSAAGTHEQFERAWLLNAARAWSRLPSGYDHMLKYAKGQAKQFYGLSDKSAIAFYRSATGAMADVVANLMDVRSGDWIMLTSQEYSSITQAFTNRGVTVEAGDVLHMNNRTEGRSLIAEEIFEQIRKRIEERGGPPKAFVFSVKTRFGDAFCAGTSKSNSKGVRHLNALLKKMYPKVPIVGDICQDIGRNDTGENNVEHLGFDVLVNSGGKAMGVSNVGTLILRTKFDTDEHWLSDLEEIRRQNPLSVLQPGVATDNIIAITALGIAMQHASGRHNTWSLDPIPEKRTFREAVSERMQELTTYCIEKAASYHEDLMTSRNFPIRNLSEADYARYAEQFGCQVVYPIHRTPGNYNGIVSVTFPNIGRTSTEGSEERFDDFVKSLEREGFKVLPCLPGRNGIRISCHMLHDTSDIDALFAQIQTIHIEQLRKQIQGKGIITIEALSGATLNVSSAWMPD